MTEFISRNQRERFADQTMDFDADGALKFWRITLEALAQTAVQFRIAGFPELVANVDAGEINIAVAEAEFDVFRVPCSVIL
jgi:hypothetical protein